MYIVVHIVSLLYQKSISHDNASWIAVCGIKQNGMSPLMTGFQEVLTNTKRARSAWLFATHQYLFTAMKRLAFFLLSMLISGYSLSVAAGSEPIRDNEPGQRSVEHTS